MFIKKVVGQTKAILDFSVCYLVYPKSLKDIYMNKCLNILINYFLNINCFRKGHSAQHCLTHSLPMRSFSTPWKHQKTERFSDIFRGRERVIGKEWIKAVLHSRKSMQFYFFNWNTFKKCNFLKQSHVKITSRSKVMLVFIFSLWRHLWQSIKIKTNVLLN